jgi:uncharacterized protein with ParB-like and HNH nuclease domain/predicted transport protein
MKAVETNFVSFINKEQQFVIPLYQRAYNWDNKQCKQLWDDINSVAMNDDIPAHFIGSIVYVAAGIYNIASTHQSFVIDGQQRLTTLSLLFLALKNKVENIEEPCSITADQIEEQFLINKYASDDDKRIKLQLTRHDREIFNSLVRGEEILDKDKSNRVYKNFKFFVNQIETSEIEVEELFTGIRKLIVVDIALDKEDNPQLIFESLNSTGLDLSQFDLIRNFVLMGLNSIKKQEDIYNKYWLPMERLFLNAQGEEKFDVFMKAYLTIKVRSIPNLNAIYSEFKKYIINRDVKETVSDVYKYAKYYDKLEFGNEQDVQIREVLSDIRTLKVEVAAPFLLEVYDDYSNELISKDEFVSVLKLVESYVFRRAITGIPTNSLNKTFAQLHRKIDKQNYVDSLKALFILKSGYHRFPTDEEFKTEFQSKDVYNFRNNKYLFEKLEYFNNKERINLEDLSVEHIMPQTLTDEWKESLGTNFQQINDKYLHTVGNLTLTGYNSDMSNRTFIEKRDMRKGFRDSNLKLNKKLGQLDVWGEDEINARAKQLSTTAINIWSYPSVSEEILDRYREDAAVENESIYSLDDYEYIQGEVLTLYELLKERIIAIDPENIQEEYKKLYIAFKTNTNFVDIVPQKSQLRLSLNMKYSEINDPNGLTRDITGLGKWGNGDVEVLVNNSENIEEIMALIKQSYDLHSIDNNQKKQLSEEQLLKMEFWTKFKGYAKKNNSKLKLRKTQPRKYTDMSIGTSLATLGLSIGTKTNEMYCYIWISNSKELFQALYEIKDVIEKELGMPLEWISNDKRTSSVIQVKTEGNIKKIEDWDKYFVWMEKTASNFQRVFKKYIIEVEDEIL